MVGSSKAGRAALLPHAQPERQLPGAAGNWHSRQKLPPTSGGFAANALALKCLIEQQPE